MRADVHTGARTRLTMVRATYPIGLWKKTEAKEQ